MSLRTQLLGPASVMLALAAGVGMFVLFGSSNESVQAADHRDSITPSTDPYADINDVYVFNDRGGMAAANRVCLAVTTNPHARGLAPTRAFSDQVRYNLHADVNDDARADATITFTFQYPTTGSPTFSVSGLTSSGVLTGALNSNVNFPIGTQGLAAPVDVFCGFREDPFFFDLTGFQQFLGGSYNFQGGAAGLRNGGTAQNTFDGQNVAAIVLEVSDDVFGGPTATFRAWATTTR